MDPATAPATPQAEDASFWQLKPWWCQPWSILLTGVAASLASWLLLHRWWITTPIALAVLLWWWLFLVLVPASYGAEPAQPAGDQNRNL
jgi:hypothetical protein